MPLTIITIYLSHFNQPNPPWSKNMQNVLQVSEFSITRFCSGQQLLVHRNAYKFECNAASLLVVSDVVQWYLDKRLIQTLFAWHECIMWKVKAFHLLFCFGVSSEHKGEGNTIWLILILWVKQLAIQCKALQTCLIKTNIYQV